MSKAPEKKVNDEKEKLRKYTEMMEKVEEELAKLG
jgi:valyl-tRNA synthetase